MYSPEESPWDIWQHLEILWVVTAGEGDAPGIPWHLAGGGRDGAEHLGCAGQPAPPQQRRRWRAHWGWRQADLKADGTWAETDGPGGRLDVPRRQDLVGR